MCRSIFNCEALRGLDFFIIARAVVLLFNDVGNPEIEVDIFNSQSILQAVRKTLDEHSALSLNTRSGVF